MRKKVYCTACGRDMVLDFTEMKRHAKCAGCGKAFGYRLLGRGIYELDFESCILEMTEGGNERESW